MDNIDFSKLSHEECIFRLERLQAQLRQYLEMNSRVLLGEILRPEGIKDSDREYMTAGIVSGLSVATDLLEGKKIGTTREWAYKTFLHKSEYDVRN